MVIREDAPVAYDDSQTRRNWKRDPDKPTSAEMLRELVDSLPPHSEEAEMSLLGSLILDPKAVGEVVSIAHGPELFYREGHAQIYKSILALYDQHEGWDAVQLLEMLRDEGKLDEIGGIEYLKQLAESVPSAVNAPHYAKLVSSKHRLRALIDASWRIIYDAHNIGALGPDGVATLLDKAEAEIYEISHDKTIRDVAPLADILQEEIARLEALEGRGLTGVATGYLELDKMLSGLQQGEMLILAARPSMGKTALALNLAEQVAFGGDSVVRGTGRARSNGDFLTGDVSWVARPTADLGPLGDRPAPPPHRADGHEGVDPASHLLRRVARRAALYR